MEFGFSVYGKVRGQGRPRADFTRKRVYKDAKDKAWERDVKDSYVNGGGPHFGRKPVAIDITVYRELPASKPKRVASEADTHKPDASNILKSVEDALNGIAYDDDCQVVFATVRKMPRSRLVERIDVVIWDVDE